jgi:hypothetical protein
MMRLVSLHLSADRILWGHVLLEYTDYPAADLEQVIIEQSDQEPGYALFDRTHRRLTDPTLPAVREADRIVRALLIPASEVAKREQAVRAVIHSGYLEGFPDDMPWQAQLWRYARGEFDVEQFDADAAPDTDSEQTSESLPIAGADVPEEWWHATQARIRGHLLASTRTDTDVAAALQVSVEEVRTLLQANRLLRFDLDGEDRIPDWQLVQPALPEFGDPSVLLPGLDVLYAAAPQQLLDAAPMTEFMTMPRSFLIIDDVPLTPLDWMRQGRPLATIVGLFRGRRW